MTAQCAAHPDQPASLTCKRCGVFMCERCTERGLEDRCRTCRPKRTAEERRERRENSVKRAEWNSCERCGYLGPRFDRLVRPSTSEVLTTFILPLMFPILGVALVVGNALRGTTQPSCPSCGHADALWAAPVGTGQHPAFLAATTAQNASWFAGRKHGLIAAAIIVLLYAVGLVLFVSSLARDFS